MTVLNDIETPLIEEDSEPGPKAGGSGEARDPLDGVYCFSTITRPWALRNTW